MDLINVLPDIVEDLIEMAVFLPLFDVEVEEGEVNRPCCDDVANMEPFAVHEVEGAFGGLPDVAMNWIAMEVQAADDFAMEAVIDFVDDIAMEAIDAVHEEEEEEEEEEDYNEEENDPSDGEGSSEGNASSVGYEAVGVSSEDEDGQREE